MENDRKSTESGGDQATHYLYKQWKCSVEMANRHHERRMLRNVVFFLPLLFVVVWLESEFLFSNQKLMIEYIFMSVGGAFGCALWLASIAKHKSIASIKYQNIHSIETKLSISLYSDEYQSLEANWKTSF